MSEDLAAFVPVALYLLFVHQYSAADRKPFTASTSSYDGGTVPFNLRQSRSYIMERDLRDCTVKGS